MKGLLHSAPFPLLGKDLVEQAARRRTYVVRVVYAVLLFLCFLLFFYEMASSMAGDIFWMLGYGKRMFEFLVAMQFVGIFLFLPAMMSAALTYEKERDSLSLLFITRLRPWEILLQKYVGHLIPMFTFLFLSLPLLAICYAYGGITTAYLSSAVFVLVLTCLQVGAWALMFSSFCSGTVQAFVCSYVMGVLFYLGPAICCVLVALFTGGRPGGDEDVLFALFPVYIFVDTLGGTLGRVAVRSIPIMLSTVVFLVLARAFLVRRAFVLRRSVMLKVFRWLDGFMHRLNRLVGGIVLVKEPDTLPENAPIAWREVSKQPLGKLSHLIRIFLLIEAPTVLIGGAVVVLGSFRGDCEELTLLLYMVWALAALILTARSANAFVSERANQTLDVLLATPMSGPDIILQKVRALRQSAFVLAVPIVTVVLIEAWAESWTRGGGPPALVYVAFSLAAAGIFLPMIYWVSLWIGLRARTRARAIITSLVVLVSWCALPILAAMALTILTGVDEGPVVYPLLLSPVSIIAMVEFPELADDVLGTPVPVLALVLTYAWHAAVWFLFRWLCLENADRYLGRIGPPAGRRTRRESKGLNRRPV